MQPICAIDAQTFKTLIYGNPDIDAERIQNAVDVWLGQVGRHPETPANVYRHHSGRIDAGIIEAFDSYPWWRITSVKADADNKPIPAATEGLFRSVAFWSPVQPPNRLIRVFDDYTHGQLRRARAERQRTQPT